MTPDEWPPTPIAYRIAKRATDILASAFGLLLVAPLLLALAVWIKLDSPGPVFYRGRRIGWHGREFRIFKFRSMVMNADKIGGPTTSDDDPRVTRSGRFIRKYKADELAQLLNIFLGDMSLVGPRPDVPSEIGKLNAEERRLILAVRPGLTDYASIEFHNEGEIVKGHADPHAAYERLIRPRKIELQQKYVRERSFLLDLKLIFRTFATLFRTRVRADETPANPS